MPTDKRYIVRRPVRLGSGKEGQIYPVNTVIGPGHGHYDQAAHESSFPNGAVDVLEGESLAEPSMAVTAPLASRKKKAAEEAPPEPEEDLSEGNNPKTSGKKK